MMCENCGKEHDGSFASGRFCSRKCSRAFSTKFNREEVNKKVSETFKNKPLIEVKCKKCGEITYSKFKIVNKLCNICKEELGYNKTICKRCGAKKGECKHPDLCKKHIGLIKSLEKYFGFDMNSLGSERYYEELSRIKRLLENEYYDNEMSMNDIAIKYGHKRCTNLFKILNSLNILFRNHKKSATLAIIKGKCIPVLNNRFKCGWHTTWNNKKVFYRSSYELEYAEQLDIEKLDYEMESLRILYYDSERCIERCAIPDFYIPEKNLIVEIKSLYTYGPQNIRDKFKAYKEHGYKTKLILDKKELILDV